MDKWSRYEIEHGFEDKARAAKLKGRLLAADKLLHIDKLNRQIQQTEQAVVDSIQGERRKNLETRRRLRALREKQSEELEERAQKEAQRGEQAKKRREELEKQKFKDMMQKVEERHKKIDRNKQYIDQARAEVQEQRKMMNREKEMKSFETIMDQSLNEIELAQKYYIAEQFANVPTDYQLQMEQERIEKMRRNDVKQRMAQMRKHTLETANTLDPAIHPGVNMMLRRASGGLTPRMSESREAVTPRLHTTRGGSRSPRRRRKIDESLIKRPMSMRQSQKAYFTKTFGSSQMGEGPRKGKKKRGGLDDLIKIGGLDHDSDSSDSGSWASVGEGGHKPRTADEKFVDYLVYSKGRPRTKRGNVDRGVAVSSMSKRSLPPEYTRKMTCALCSHSFTQHNMPYVVPYRTVWQQKRQWNVPEARSETLSKKLHSMFYRSVRVCVFCYQFLSTENASNDSPAEEETNRTPRHSFPRFSDMD